MFVAKLIKCLSNMLERLVSVRRMLRSHRVWRCIETRRGCAMVLVSHNYHNKICCVTLSCAVHCVRVGTEARDGEPQHDMDCKPPEKSTAVDPIESEWETLCFKAIMSLRSFAGHAQGLSDQVWVTEAVDLLFIVCQVLEK